MLKGYTFPVNIPVKCCFLGSVEQLVSIPLNKNQYSDIIKIVFVLPLHVYHELDKKIEEDRLLVESYYKQGVLWNLPLDELSRHDFLITNIWEHGQQRFDIKILQSPEYIHKTEDVSNEMFIEAAKKEVQARWDRRMEALAKNNMRFCLPPQKFNAFDCTHS